MILYSGIIYLYKKKFKGLVIYWKFGLKPKLHQRLRNPPHINLLCMESFPLCYFHLLYILYFVNKFDRSLLKVRKNILSHRLKLKFYTIDQTYETAALFIGAAIQVARIWICMGDDRLAGRCTDDVGVALSVGVIS